VAPTSLEKCVEVLRARPDVALVYPGTMLIDADGQEIGPHEERLQTLDEDPIERFRHVREQIALCNAMYGVMRTETLRRTHLLGAFPGSDEILHAELALYGKVVELPGAAVLSAHARRCLQPHDARPA
jgi:hypothetical protein